MVGQKVEWPSVPRVEASFLGKVDSKVAHYIKPPFAMLNQYSTAINVGTVILLYLLYYIFSPLSKSCKS